MAYAAISMNRVEKSLAVALGGILLSVLVRADVPGPAGNPYQVIVDRNGFGLKPTPPPPTNAAPTNPVAPANIKFTGITSDPAGGRKAWMVIPAQPGKGSNAQYLTMAEHEKQGDIEVIEINEKDSIVKILNAGQPVELNFKDYGMATPPPPAATGPGVPHGVPGAVPAPGIVPAPGTPPPNAKTAGYTPGAAPGGNMASRYGLQPSGAAAANDGTAPNTGLRTIPSRTVRTQPLDTQIGSPMNQPPGRQFPTFDQNGIPVPPVPGR